VTTAEKNGRRREGADHRADYRYFLAIPTRWMDNDATGT
jgi:hypothetical protein